MYVIRKVSIKFDKNWFKNKIKISGANEVEELNPVALRKGQNHNKAIGKP